MDPGPRGIELRADERVVRRNGGLDGGAEVLSDFADDASVHAVLRPPQRDVLHHRGFQRRIAGALPEPEHRCVEGGDAVEPGRGGVHVDLVEVVMPVPLQELGRVAQLADKRVHEPGNASRQDRARVRHPVAHGVAEPDFHGNPALIAKLQQLLGKRQAKAVDVRPGDVFQVAPDPDPLGQRLLYDAEVFVHGFSPGRFELQKDVVIRGGGEDAGFPDSQVLHNSKVRCVCPDPPRDLGEIMAKGKALLDRFPVALAVEKELALADDSFWPAQPVQERVDLGDLLWSVRRPRLLAVTERSVRYPYLARR